MKTKYKIGQMVWVLIDYTPQQMKVDKITIFSETRTNYSLDNRYSLDEDKIGATKEELKKLMFD